MQTLHLTAAARLRRIGQSYTRARRAIVEALADADAPMSVPELVEAHPNIPVSTAYRSLAVLKTAGVVESVSSGADHTYFELAEGMTGEHHHHLVCTSCGAVVDFRTPPGFERRMSSLMEAVASDSGFQASAHRFDLLGTCASCSAR